MAAIVAPGVESISQMSPRTKAVVMAGTLLGLFTAAMDQTVVSTSMPRHHRGPRRLRSVQLGGHRLHDGLHGHRSRHRQAVGHIRTQAVLHGGHPGPAHRFCPVRLLAERRTAHRVPHHPGTRRRDDHGHRLRDHRGRLHAGRTGALGRPDVRRIRICERARPADRRHV